MKERADRERYLCALLAQVDACKQALDGQEPSDFMQSFDIVRDVWSLRCAVDETKEALK